MDLLEENGVIKSIKDDKCPACGHKCRLKEKSKSLRTLKCNNKGCNKTFSRVRGTFFDGAKIPLYKVYAILISYLLGFSHQQIMSQTKCARQTITDYMAFVRQMLSDSINETELEIGGEGIEVEVDESKFAKRKYNKGHSVGNKEWVIGGIEKYLRPGETKRRYWAVAIGSESRDNRTTLLPHD